jgi:hypothetical protein
MMALTMGNMSNTGTAKASFGIKYKAATARGRAKEMPQMVFFNVSGFIR